MRKRGLFLLFFVASAMIAVYAVAQPGRGGPPGGGPPGGQQRGQQGGPPGGQQRGQQGGFEDGQQRGQRDGFPGEQQRTQRGQPPFAPPPHPVLEALDQNGDNELSASEIQNAVAALLSLDRNGDGILNDADLQLMQRSGDGARQGGRRGGPGNSGGPDGFQGNGPPRGDRAGGPGGRERDRDSRDNERGDQRGPDRMREGEPPSPEQIIDRAMSFDSDGDGKLGVDELKSFFQQMGPPRSDRGRDGFGGPPSRSEEIGGERPQRNRRDRNDD